MLTTSTLKQKIDSLWDKFWSGGIANPLTSVGRFSESSLHRNATVFNKASDNISRGRNGVSSYKPCSPK